MYAFVEQWITSTLNLEFEEYPLSDGKRAHIIDEVDFQYVTHFFQHIAGEDQRNEIGITVIPSCVRGMRLLLMKYWEDETILYSLTDGDIKTNSRFQIFMNWSYPRFDLEPTCRRLRDIAREHYRLRGEVFAAEVVIPDWASATESQGPEPSLSWSGIALNTNSSEEVKLADIIIPKLKNPGERFINTFLQNRRGSNYSYREVNNNFVITDVSMPTEHVKYFINLSKKIDKNIFCISECGLISTQMKKENITNVDMAKHTVIINMIPSSSGFYPGKSGLTICLGEKVTSIYKVLGNNENNKRIREINGNFKLTKEEKEAKVNEIYEKKENSPFFKYDCVFKDTYTGTIWAVRDRCFIFFLFEISDQNEKFIEVSINEIGERFNMDIPYRRLLEIDRNYFRNFSSDNLNDYVNFSMQSCKVVFNSINNLLEEQVSLYKKYLSQAMECAKMVSKYQDQLEIGRAHV